MARLGKTAFSFYLLNLELNPIEETKFNFVRIQINSIVVHSTGGTIDLFLVLLAKKPEETNKK
jgi:hypothetical protein